MKNFIIYCLAFVVLAFTGCEEATETYTLKGTVINNFGRVVKNATVSVKKTEEGNAIKTGTTDVNGLYSIDGIEEGTYYIEVNAVGYDIQWVSQNVKMDVELEIEISGSIDISGVIINSQTGGGLANASLSFSAMNQGQDFATIDTIPDHADFYVTTDAYGYYDIEDAPYGIFCLVLRAVGFTPRIYVNVTLQSGYYYEFDPIVVVENVPEGSLRFILTWGDSPSDLDSHLTGPIVGSTERFHCYYGNSAPYESDVNLDVDDTYSYGPETTTIEVMHNGMYRFSVHNYSDQSYNGWSGIYNSPARVEMWTANGLEQIFVAPVGTTGNTWQVCEVNVSGTNYSVNALNSYIYADYSGDVPLKKKGQFNANELKFKAVKK